MSVLHFTINLNKYGELKQQEEAEKKVFRNFTIFFVVGTIILYSIVLYFNHTLNRKYENRVKFLSQVEKEILKYRTSGENLSSRDLENLSTTVTDRVFWARKLEALSKSMDDKIAVTHFGYKNNVWSLYGITEVDENKNEADLVDAFRLKLKQNEDINIDFAEFKTVRIVRDREKETDILRFQIDAMGKKGNRRRGGA
ncbi:MAG: hypothetical protein FWG20_05840 [Candidatus Cloacimonetes bacterium]|nr:hypothetical protein [Candidatus Cloacimonadota bacterium]